MILDELILDETDGVPVAPTVEAEVTHSTIAEAQAAGEIGIKRRTRPVVAAGAHTADPRAIAATCSRQEDSTGRFHLGPVLTGP